KLKKPQETFAKAYSRLTDWRDKSSDPDCVALFKLVREMGVHAGPDHFDKAMSQPMNDTRSGGRSMTANRSPTPAAHTREQKSAPEDNARLEQLVQEHMRRTSRVMSKTEAVNAVLDTPEGKAIRERDKARQGIT